MATISFYHAIILVIYFMLQLSCVHCTKTPKLGFSTYLIHRDSFESPSYDPSLNQSTLLTRSIHRSMSRLLQFKSIPNLDNNNSNRTIDNVTIIRDSYEYFIDLSIGDPPVQQLAILTTASDIIWTQCQPCVRCYRQIQPIFNPRKSLSYSELACNSDACQYLRKEPHVNVMCPAKTSKPCRYSLLYNEQSTSYGVLSEETFKLSRRSHVKMVYGCSNDNRGQFPFMSAGIVGLGYGNFSLVGQLYDYIGGKFSYCLMHWWRPNGKSTINFGTNAIVSGPEVVSTPLLVDKDSVSYHVTLEAVSVGNIRISFNGEATTMQDENNNVEKGNMVIDTASLTTHLPRAMFQKLVKTLRMKIKAKTFEQSNKMLRLCYKEAKDLRIPTITFHFAGGADLALESENTMIPYYGILCLIIVPTDHQAVFGTRAQMHYLIGYDLEKMTVSFQPSKC